MHRSTNTLRSKLTVCEAGKSSSPVDGRLLKNPLILIAILLRLGWL
jgi:hypothetical protein